MLPPPPPPPSPPRKWADVGEAWLQSPVDGVCVLDNRPERARNLAGRACARPGEQSCLETGGGTKRARMTAAPRSEAARRYGTNHGDGQHTTELASLRARPRPGQTPWSRDAAHSVASSEPDDACTTRAPDTKRPTAIPYPVPSRATLIIRSHCAFSLRSRCSVCACALASPV